MDKPMNSGGKHDGAPNQPPKRATAFVGVLGSSHKARWPATLFGHATEIIRKHHLSLAVCSRTPLGSEEVANSRQFSTFVGRPFPLTACRQPNLETGFGDEAAAERYLSNFDGRFSLLICSGSSLLLATDLIGACPVYYNIEDDVLRFGSHLGLLLRALPNPPKVNRLGLASVLLARGRLLDETHFVGIHRLPPGGYLMASKGEKVMRVRMGKYGDLRDLAADERAPSASVRAFDDVFADAVRREGYGSNAALMLSGGRDSQAIALAAEGAIPAAVTFGTADSTDVVLARRRARKLGFRHYVVPYESWSLETYVTETVGLYAGCVGLQTAHNVIGFDWARRVAGLAVVGMLGGPLTGQHLTGASNSLLERTMLGLIPNRRFGLVSAALPEECAHLERTVTHWFSEAQRDLSPAQAALVLDLERRQAGNIGMTFDLCSWFIDISTPFYNRALITMLMRADPKALAKRQPYDDWLAKKAREAGAAMQTYDWLYVYMALSGNALSRGRWPSGRLYWPHVMQRTAPALRIAEYECGDPVLDRLLHSAWRASLTDKQNRIPLLAIVAPVSLSLRSILNDSWSGPRSERELAV